MPKTARVRATPFKMEPMTKQTRERVSVEESPLAEHRVGAMDAEADAFEAAAGAAPPQSSALRSEKVPEQAEQSYDPVTVFYATDRKELDASADAIRLGNELIPLVAAASVTLLLIFARLHWLATAVDAGTHGRRTTGDIGVGRPLGYGILEPVSADGGPRCSLWK